MHLENDSVSRKKSTEELYRNAYHKTNPADDDTLCILTAAASNSYFFLDELYGLLAAAGIKANKAKMKTYLYNSLMTVTGLTPIIGYENAAKVVHKAHEEGTTLKEACLALGYLDEKTFDEKFQPERMV